MASVTDANNHSTAYSYNSLGLLSQVTPPSPLGIQTFSYDSYDRESAQADGLGHSTGYSLDQVGNILAESYADGSSITHTYDGDGNITNTTGELTDQGAASQQQVTNGGFETGTSPWVSNPSTLGWRTYDPTNAHSGSYYAKLVASLTYSQQLWQTVSVPSHYSKLTFSYWLSISTSKTNTCDAFTAQIRTTGGTPITTVSSPCPSGSLGLGKWGQESVDLTFALASYRGQQVQVFFQAQNPSTDQTSATYRVDDVALTAATDNTTYTYNALGQQTQQAIQNGGSIAMTYDGVGNMLTTADSTGTVTYTYGANDEVASAKDQWGVQTTYSYDQDRNQTQISYQNGSQQFSYNNAGQPTGMTVLNGSGATLASLSWNYTNPATNRQTDLVYSSTDIGANVTTNTFDSLGQLTQATVKNSSGSTIHTYSYTYDPVGNLLSRTEDGTTTSMSYNAADELTQAGSTTYTYDANGNRTGDSTGGKLAYNTAGQTTSITPSGGSALNMSYQGSGQRQRVAAGSNTYQYDLTGIKSYFNAPKGTSAYIMDRPRGQMPVEYHYSGNTYYYIIDPNTDSVVAIYDPSLGSLKNVVFYTPTGEIAYGSQYDSSSPYTWAGLVGGDGSGYQTNGDCFYDPTTGQLVTCDDPTYFWVRLDHHHQQLAEAAFLAYGTIGLFLELNHFAAHKLSILLIGLAFLGSLEGAFAAGVVKCRKYKYLDIYYRTFKIWKIETPPIWASVKCENG